MVSDALFDVPALKHAPPPPENLSADQKRTRRQLAALVNGQHPLSLTLSRPLPLHPDAAPPGDTKADGLRCGNCRFRELLSYGPRNWPKCMFGDGVRRSHGAGTDVRKWWPACSDYQPKDVTP
ncbi:hypothetical protein [Actinomadura rubrisoli]|uniref:Uncharacterized protein n=1 Tax=Actinomadura rubrisoli TaxID=2530368 RepID=A0A4R5B2D2_9ACTN|nr:hypothetical protein [Actinomadura rubrisoli]TDD77714.1 hypothetical protein E1298_29745 [Actinomadura rubrisoli]